MWDILRNDVFKQGEIVGIPKKKSRYDDSRFGGRGKKGGRRDIEIVEADNEITKHNLIRNRYVEVTPMVSRRVPVAVALIVDQDHIDYVQQAFNNSKLRFLTTQESFNRFPGSLRPQLPIEPMAGGADTPNSRNYRPEPVQPTAGADDLEINIEMLIYGIVTLYERYPPPLIPPTVPGAPPPPPAPLPK